METRKALLSDVPVLAVINHRLIEDERHPNPMNLEQLQERMAGWLQAEYTGYLAFDDESPIAYCLYRDDARYFYLRQLYVERGWRRRGIATQLLDWMFVQVWGDKKVRLDVLVHNQAAVDFYTRYGFRTAVLRMEK